MQKDLKELLNTNGIVLKKINFETKEKEQYEQKYIQEDKEIYRIDDSERLIFLVEMNDISKEKIEKYVDLLAQWVIYEKSTIGNDFFDEYNHISMRMILWDIYIIFVRRLNAEKEKLHDEEIYPFQRDRRLMKRYIIQGISDEEIASRINFIINPEEAIDDYINTLNYDSNEEENCKLMRDTNGEKEIGIKFRGNSYKEILDILTELNSEDFGENLDEDTRD